LRSTFPCVDDNSILHRSGIEPFPDQAQNYWVCNAMGYHLAQPLMIYASEMAADVGFKHLSYFLCRDLHAQNRQS